VPMARRGRHARKVAVRPAPVAVAVASADGRHRTAATILWRRLRERAPHCTVRISPQPISPSAITQFRVRASARS
jgi:hypothetical protein